MIVSYHTHTTRCMHAFGSEREYIEMAISRGIKTLGFSDHTPQVFPNGYASTFRMLPKETENYFSTLAELRERYADRIEIKLGLEVEYYPAVFDSLIELVAPFKPDYFILGQHYIDNEFDTHRYSGSQVDKSGLVRYVDQISEGISTGRFTYIAHPDLINYPKDDEIYFCEMRRLCENAKRLGIPLELNLLGLSEKRHYPRESFWRIVSEVKNDVVIGCDAHVPSRVAAPNELEEGRAYLSRFGLKAIDPTLRDPLNSIL